jgi:hypothetical protein
VPDVGFILIVIAFFIGAGAMAAGCDRLIGGRRGEEDQR